MRVGDGDILSSPKLRGATYRFLCFFSDVDWLVTAWDAADVDGRRREGPSLRIADLSIMPIRASSGPARRLETDARRLSSARVSL